MDTKALTYRLVAFYIYMQLWDHSFEAPFHTHSRRREDLFTTSIDRIVTGVPALLDATGSYRTYIDYLFGRMVKTGIEITSNWKITLDYSVPAYSSWLGRIDESVAIRNGLYEAIDCQHCNQSVLENLIAENAGV